MSLWEIILNPVIFENFPALTGVTPFRKIPTGVLGCKEDLAQMRNESPQPEYRLYIGKGLRLRLLERAKINKPMRERERISLSFRANASMLNLGGEKRDDFAQRRRICTIRRTTPTL